LIAAGRRRIGEFFEKKRVPPEEKKDVEEEKDPAGGGGIDLGRRSQSTSLRSIPRPGRLGNIQIIRRGG